MVISLVKYQYPSLDTYTPVSLSNVLFCPQQSVWEFQIANLLACEYAYGYPQPQKIFTVHLKHTSGKPLYEHSTSLYVIL